MTMTPEQIASAWALVNAATEGPWIVDYEGEPHAIATEDEWQVCKLYANCGYPEDRMSSNAAFIAAARELFPQLLTALEAERAKVQTLVEAAESLLLSVCGPTGFAEAVRHNSGKAYPWHSLDAAEAQARAALAKIKGADHE